MTDLSGVDHVWHERIFGSMQNKCCMNCGFILNNDKPNKPCPGPISVKLRRPNLKEETSEPS